MPKIRSPSDRTICGLVWKMLLNVLAILKKRVMEKKVVCFILKEIFLNFACRLLISPAFSDLALFALQNSDVIFAHFPTKFTDSIVISPFFGS